MNANKMLLVVATAMLTACSGHKEPTGEKEAPPPPPAQYCREITIPTECQDALDGHTVNLNLNTGNVAPPNVCASPGGSLTLKITPHPSDFCSVVVLPKDAGSDVDWLKRCNNGAVDEIIIEIPADQALSGRNFNYRVGNLTEGGCVDPMIHIN